MPGWWWAGLPAGSGRRSSPGLDTDRTEGDQVAGRDGVCGGDSGAVDGGAVGGSEVVDVGFGVAHGDAAVVGADGWVVEVDGVGGVAADGDGGVGGEGPVGAGHDVNETGWCGGGLGGGGTCGVTDADPDGP